MQVEVDGKHFLRGGRRLPVRGVTYGTFRPRASDGARFPEREQLKLDMAAMDEAGFTVVRTYTPPPDDVLEVAADWGLLVFAGAFWLDWRYLLGSSRREVRRMVRDAKAEVRTTARSLAGAEQVFALSLGNEVPADVIRWYGADHVAGVIDELVEVVREEDPDRLVTYANYPTAEYLPLENLDFLTFNLFLERRQDLRRYLTRLHTLAGDRPLVLGELGLHAPPGPAGEQRQADAVDWQLETALERGVAGTCVFSWTDEWWVGDQEVTGWRFGLTREDRSPRPALDVAARWNRMTVADLDDRWPAMSVVVCAYNASETLDECLRHTCALDYPDLDIVVVDDGSTDESAAIAERHPRARLVRIPHAGLSVARNEGFRAARGDIVAYLDSDAYPSPEWPYYLALAFDRRDVGGAGGPNVPPPDEPLGAQVVAQAPGGPVHVLVTDDRAEHVPGCNMAFWKHVLEEVGGFDPIYTSAGDDVDLCWKVLDRRWAIGFHPAALVWHHRRPGLRRYLRQQRGYGRAEALVEARHPDRFSPIGTARWRGRIYNSLVPSVTRARIYRGVYGAAAYQSIYQGGGHALDLAHQVGVPLAAATVATAPLAGLSPWLGAPAAAAATALAVLAVVDAWRARPPRALTTTGQRLGFRASVAIHDLLQPLVRSWGRFRGGPSARRDLPPPSPLAGPAVRLPGGVVLLPEDRARPEITAEVIGILRRAGSRVLAPTGWEDYDARLPLSALLAGELVSTAHPIGSVQVRLRLRPRLARVAATAAVVGGTTAAAWPLGLLVAALVAGDVALGWWKANVRLPRTIARTTA
jgi:glycosyltransferase involved in cell wall biosynthesis